MSIITSRCGFKRIAVVAKHCDVRCGGRSGGKCIGYLIGKQVTNAPCLGCGIRSGSDCEVHAEVQELFCRALKAVCRCKCIQFLLCLCRCIDLRLCRACRRGKNLAVRSKDLCEVCHRAIRINQLRLAVPAVAGLQRNRGINLLDCHASVAVSEHCLFNLVRHFNLSSGRVKNLGKLHTVLAGIRRLSEYELCRIAVAECVKEIQVDNTSACAGNIGVVLVDDTGQICLRGSLRRICHVCRTHDSQCRNSILLDITGLLINLPAHNVVTDTGHCKVSCCIHIERAISGKEVLLTVVDNKEIISVDHDIERISGRLCRTLTGNVDIDSATLYAEADLSGIDTTGSRRGIRSARSLRRLAHQVAEGNRTGLISRRIYVCNVVTDNVHLGLVGLQSCHTRIKRSHHSACSSCFAEAGSPSVLRGAIAS